MVILKGIGTILFMLILLAFVIFVIFDSNHALWEKFKKVLKLPSENNDEDAQVGKIMIKPSAVTLPPGLPVIKIYGNNTVKRGYIYGKEFWIGRSQDCEVVIENKTISEKHAVICQEDAQDGKYYTLKNCSEHSTLEVKDYENQCYHPLKLGQKFFLEGNQIFYLGNIKIEIQVFMNSYQEEFTENIDTNQDKNTAAEFNNNNKQGQTQNYQRKKYDL